MVSIYNDVRNQWNEQNYSKIKITYSVKELLKTEPLKMYVCMCVSTLHWVFIVDDDYKYMYTANLWFAVLRLKLQHRNLLHEIIYHFYTATSF